MPTDCITYQESRFFSKIIIDYLNQNPKLNSFYNHFSSIENFEKQIDEKSTNYDFENRKILVSELENQYKNFELSDKTKNNIQFLKESNCFTITTGHQLNLFTGPLYFLYKIISTINLTEKLKTKYPKHNFVPVYWMASEDHDFEEVNYFNFKNSKIKWNKVSSGPVGRLSIDGLQKVYEIFEKEIGIGENATYLKTLFKNSYLKKNNLSEATRFLANELFKSNGLVILDGDSKNLKKIFIPYINQELLYQSSFKKVNEINQKLIDNDYEIQVNPREINLFYIEDTMRERIIFENGKYKINNTKIEFTEAEILEEVNKNPEKFSPNVILRPLYQEVILPNLCYIGGGGELAYWFQLKSNFDLNKVTFPILLLRNSVLLTTKKQSEKADKLNLFWKDLFLNQQELFVSKTKEFSKLKIDFFDQKNFLKQQFENLVELSKLTDKSFLGAVKAQEAKQLKGLDNLEKRLLKAEKKVYADKLNRIFELQEQLFPKQGLQERKLNFSEFYLEFGSHLISKIKENLEPLSQNFTIINL